MTIEAGKRFGRLVSISVVPGSKRRKPLVRCLCDCGQGRRVRPHSLNKGLITQCARCSVEAARTARQRVTPEHKRLMKREVSYKMNARLKGHEWAIDRIAFRQIVSLPCRYCGKEPSGGIDRIDNHIGYTVENSAPCCSICNYAKRDMTEAQFMAWIKSAHDHLFGGK